MSKDHIAYILTQPDTAIAEIRGRCKAAKGQVLVLVPEISTADHIRLALGDIDTDRIIIGTRKDLFRPWDNLTDIIVEDPLNEAYKSEMSPRYSTPDVARRLAELHGAMLTYLSPALSTVNHYLAKKNIFSLDHQKPYWPQVIMADMIAEQQRDNRSILSRHAQDTILDALETPQRILVFSPRKAYSTTLRCERCHYAVICAACQIPMRVHRTSEDMLVCYRCGAYTTMPKQCPACKAGRLKPGGIAGSQKIAQAINDCLDRFGHKKISIPILDSDLVKTPAHKKEIFAQYEETKPQILIATQMILSYRYAEQFDHVIIVGADALSYNPDFRTQERLIYQLEKLADFRPATMTIQYWDENTVFAQAPDRSWESFYERELADRKAFFWPPFSRIAKITSKTSSAARIASDRLRRAAEHLGITKGVSILGPTPDYAIIIKTSLAAEQFNILLSHLPAGASIDLDPRSIV